MIASLVLAVSFFNPVAIGRSTDPATLSVSGRAVEPGTNIGAAHIAIWAVSPSQIAKTTTNATGHFIFFSLHPDTYRFEIVSPGYVICAGYHPRVEFRSGSRYDMNIPAARHCR